jgi:hypothetical protein
LAAGIGEEIAIYDLALFFLGGSAGAVSRRFFVAAPGDYQDFGLKTVDPAQEGLIDRDLTGLGAFHDDAEIEAA